MGSESVAVGECSISYQRNWAKHDTQSNQLSPLYHLSIPCTLLLRGYIQLISVGKAPAKQEAVTGYGDTLKSKINLLSMPFLHANKDKHIAVNVKNYLSERRCEHGRNLQSPLVTFTLNVGLTNLHHCGLLTLHHHSAHELPLSTTSLVDSQKGSLKASAVPLSTPQDLQD